MSPSVTPVAAMTNVRMAVLLGTHMMAPCDPVASQENSVGALGAEWRVWIRACPSFGAWNKYAFTTHGRGECARSMMVPFRSSIASASEEVSHPQESG
jgi:hypothetical protein